MTGEHLRLPLKFRIKSDSLGIQVRGSKFRRERPRKWLNDLESAPIEFEMDLRKHPPGLPPDDCYDVRPVSLKRSSHMVTLRHY